MRRMRNGQRRVQFRDASAPALASADRVWNYLGAQIVHLNRGDTALKRELLEKTAHCPSVLE